VTRKGRGLVRRTLIVRHVFPTDKASLRGRHKQLTAAQLTALWCWANRPKIA